MTVEDSGAAGGEFYDAVYGAFEGQLAATVRAEAFGEDIGQNSWLTAEECRMFFDWLELGSSSEVLDVGSGSGGPALFMVSETGCSVTGLELHGAAVAAANRAAGKRDLAAQARFVQGDGRDPLPFPTASFDALLCIDSINHMYERLSVFQEWHRVLRAGGRALFTDPLTVTGLLRREEILLRSGSLGEQVFTTHGVNERLLRAAGFDEVRIEDVTPNMAAVAAARRRARVSHVAELAAVEGEEGSAAYDRYLAVVELLASERRLSRWAYLAARST